PPRRRGGSKPDEETLLAVVDAWNDSVQGTMPKAHGLAKKGRPELIAKALAKSHGDVGALRDLFRACAASPHHRGENDRGWVATLDWLLNPKTRDEKAELWDVDWDQALAAREAAEDLPLLHGAGGLH
ncbi:hypothetical protein, partial [Teichococcus deserti]|uniref:hypothetical protein n=1 Tax=Teichococcus deserti TaxID=1817963 RepID=UPI001A964156